MRHKGEHLVWVSSRPLPAGPRSSSRLPARICWPPDREMCPATRMLRVLIVSEWLVHSMGNGGRGGCKGITQMVASMSESECFDRAKSHVAVDYVAFLLALAVLTCRLPRVQVVTCSRRTATVSLR
jgi:hypothetical protein